MSKVKLDMPADPETSAASIDAETLKAVFSDNLRELTKSFGSVVSLCRQIGINRAQFNRYLAGESFPRSDLLYKICVFFDVDARVLTEPLETITHSATSPFMHPALVGFFGERVAHVDEGALPSGFYRFSRRSFVYARKFVHGVAYIARHDGICILRGHEARQAMRFQGPREGPRMREFRGLVMRQDDGLTIIVSRRGAASNSFNFLSRVPSSDRNFCVGYACRPVPENVGGRRFERQVYEYVGRGTKRALPIARTAGLVEFDKLPPSHQSLLDLDGSIT